MKGEGCSFPLENNLQCVKHFRISGQELPINSINYFPNVTQMTIEHSSLKPDESILINLNHLIPLQQLTHLNIEYNWFPLEDVIRLIGSTPSLHTLKLHFAYIAEKDLKFLEQSVIFQDVSAKNQIRHVYCSNRCELTKIQFFMKLFPQMEYFHVSTNRSEINEIISHFFPRNFQSFHRLVYLCLTGIPKICLQEVDRFIKSNNLLENYSLKYLHRDLYIWW